MEINESERATQRQSASEPKSLNLPDIAIISAKTPFSWLLGGFRDFRSAIGPCLAYGMIMALISAAISYAIVFSGHSDWIMVLIGGFFLIGPMLAMGLYEAGRQIEAGRQPRFTQMAFVKSAFRQDLAYLGLGLLLLYFFWGRMAQLIYALSTYRKHDDVLQFINFMLTTNEGHNMAIAGTIAGGIIAFIAYTLVVISAPMLLDRKTDVFVASITSFRAVTKNPLPMLVWAILITFLIAIGILSGFIGLAVIFPVLGLASWRAYRELVPKGHFPEEV